MNYILIAFAIFSASCELTNNKNSSPLESEGIAFIFMGDSGTGKQAQYDVATGIKSYCLSNSCQFATLLGDNFYTFGVGNSRDKHFNNKFEKPYADLNFDFYPVLGNHDHYGNTQAQVDYTQFSTKWKMPAKYYHYVKGNVQFFAIDSSKFDATQQSWLKNALSTSQAKWKIVYGHHPVFSYGLHGNTSSLITTLKPMLEEHKVDFYLSGHDHDKQVIEKDGIPYIVSGAAAKLRNTQQGADSIFAISTLGFAHMKISGNSAVVKILDKNGAVEFEKTFAKRSE
jgi:tartrate-resistant acid phosphatase type 5